MSTFTPQQTLAIQTVGITTSLLTAGAISSISLMVVPLLRSVPTQDGLPFLRQLFSTGSHTFPQAVSLASTCYGVLAYTASTSALRNRHIIAASCGLAIIPWTFLVMKGPNMELMSIKERQDDKGKEGVKEKGGDEKVDELLMTFKWENMVRGVMVALGGVLGLGIALGY